MDLRARVEEDLDRCAELARLVHDVDGYPPFLPGGDTRRFLTAPECARAWVAQEDGSIVGHVALHSRSSPPVMHVASEATGRRAEGLSVVARLFVSPDMRNKGIGRALLFRASAAAVEQGRWPVLDVATRFTTAIHLYERLGWSAVATVTVPLPNGPSLEEHVLLAPRSLVEPQMPADQVVALVEQLEGIGVTVWVDGGWAVDALLEEQTRPHADLDIVIEHIDEPKVRNLLQAHGYGDVERDDTTGWNYVLGDLGGHQVDIHVIELESDGSGRYGPPERGLVYPAESLTGRGTVAGRDVRCISPKWLVQFHTGYDLDENDYRDMYALHERFGVPLPPEYGVPPPVRPGPSTNPDRTLHLPINRQGGDR